MQTREAQIQSDKVQGLRLANERAGVNLEGATTVEVFQIADELNQRAEQVARAGRKLNRTGLPGVPKEELRGVAEAAARALTGYVFNTSRVLDKVSRNDRMGRRMNNAALAEVADTAANDVRVWAVATGADLENDARRLERIAQVCRNNNDANRQRDTRRR